MATYSNLFIDQGSDFEFDVDLTTSTTLDLTGYGAAGSIAKSYQGAIKETFEVTIDTTNTKLDVSLNAAQTAAMKPGRYVYDIIIKSSGGVITRVLEGQLEIMPAVTFDADAPEAGTPAASKSIFSFTNTATLSNEDVYAFIELDAPGGILPYYQTETGTTSSITVKLRLKEVQNPEFGRVRLFLANQTFVEEHRNLSIGTYSNTTFQDHHGFNTIQPLTSDSNFINGGLNQGLNTITLSLNADNGGLGEFKYLVIAYEDTGGTAEQSGTFEISELEITASTHPENNDDTTVFKIPKQVINTFSDEATHYTDTSTIRKFESISSTTGLFKS